MAPEALKSRQDSPDKGLLMSATRFCPSCGAPATGSDRFCALCGQALTGAPLPGSPTPAPYPVYSTAQRPATAGSFLSGMFDTWKSNFWTFFAVYLILGLVTGTVSAAISYGLYGVIAVGTLYGLPSTTGVSTANLGLLALYLIAGIAALVIVTTVVAGGMTEYAVRRFRGESMSVEQALRRGLQKFVSLFGAILLLIVIVVLIVVLPAFLVLPWVFAGGGGGAIAAVILGVIVGAILAVYVVVSLLLFAPAIMMENATAVGSLSRSWALTRGHRASLFGAVLVVGIVSAIVSALIGIPGAFIPVAGIVTSAISSAITGSWVAILSAVSYDILTRPNPSSTGPVSPPWPPHPF